MSSRIARQIQMVSRPAGMPGHEHFRIVEVELPAPGAGQVLVENRYMSVDPYMRGRMRAEGVYAAPYPLNAPLYGGAVGEVLGSG
ncbi:MAG: NADP-dependent oxidoreductase, partial [Gammaproteobacteria bacterium]|nr:NADP-dependent oxidoreductase [Gammaproteobacteria bacterium]